MGSTEDPDSYPRGPGEDRESVRADQPAGPKTCPQCGLLNPAGALRCDCGYDFASRSVKASYLPPAKVTLLSPLSTTDLMLCFFFAPIGIIVGLVRAAQRKPGAWKMVGISALMILLVLVLQRVLP